MELFLSLVKFLVECFVSSILLHIVGSVVRYELFLPTTVTIAVVGVTFYNLYFYPTLLSPLRRLPRVQLHDIRYLLPVTDVPRGDLALQWAKKYPESDMIRINVGFQTVLAPFSPNALRDVLGTHQADFEKPTSGRNYLSRILGYGLILSEGLTHARQRKTLTSSFRIQNIRALHDLMLAKTKIMISAMEQQTMVDGACEINSWASKVTLDIIGHTLISQEFNSLRVDRQPVNEAFKELTAESFGQTLHFASGMLLPKALVAALPTKTNAMISRNARIIREACNDALQTRVSDPRKSTAAGSEILSSILRDPLAGHQEIIDQMLTFLGAGHETTATSVAWATHLLTLPEYTHYQETLRQEISAYPDCAMSPLALESLPWLNAICEETLRLYPPVTTTARKAIRDTTVAGTRVPKNTLLVLFPWAVNRHPSFWGSEQAERFVPERWLDGVGSGDGLVRFNKHGGAKSNYCELTFLHGNRSCIGKDFAKAELRCILANIFGQFKVTRREGDSLVAEPAGSITIKPKGGLFVRLERVNTL